MIREFEIRQRELDFTSAGLGRESSRVLLSDEVAIINALKFFEFDANPAQTIICEQCGTPHCATGSWVALRTLGDAVLLIPAIAEMRQGDWELHEYRPPHYIEQRGAVLFPDTVYQSLRSQIPGFPESAMLPPLQAQEVIALLQWEAPHQVLGRFPDEIAIRRQDVLAVSRGDRDVALSSLEQLLRVGGGSSTAVRLVSSVDVATFYIDGPGTPEWSPLAFGSSDEGLLHLAAGVSVSVDQD